jgi:hypothetical protein
MRYKGGVISATAPTTSSSAATGVWTLPQQFQAKAASNWPDPNVPTVIGQAFGGGFYAGQIGVSSVATHYLVIGPVASAESSSKQLKTTNTSTTGTTSDIDGPTNSSNMNNASHPAAFFCEGLTIGGFSDWYLPAKNEFEVCYYNLKPTTASNNTSYGINPNAVPARGSNYTAGTPAQTSAADFQVGGAQAFPTSLVWYWSSTEYVPNGIYGWIQRTLNGGQYYTTKTAYYRVRAIRRVAV